MAAHAARWLDAQGCRRMRAQMASEDHFENSFTDPHGVFWTARILCFVRALNSMKYAERFLFAPVRLDFKC